MGVNVQLKYYGFNSLGIDNADQMLLLLMVMIMLRGCSDMFIIPSAPLAERRERRERSEDSWRNIELDPGFMDDDDYYEGGGWRRGWGF